MKNLKLLNKYYLSALIFCCFFGFTVQSEEPIDIWNIEEKKTIKNLNIIENIEKKNVTENSI